MMRYFSYNLYPDYIAVVSSLSSNFAFRYVSLALISKWSFENRGPPPSKVMNGTLREHSTTEEREPASSRERFKFGLRASVYPRKVGTPYEVKNVPHFSSCDPNYTPSRVRFSIRNAVGILASHIIIHLFRLDRAKVADVLFDLEKIPFLTRYDQISRDEIIFRVKSTIIFWFILYNMVYSFFGPLNLIIGASGLSEVKFCRPVLGPISEAYSVRQFWG